MRSTTIRPKTNQQGIALFQVLLITAVITVMAIQFTQTARNQLSIASTIVDRVQAQAILRSTEADLIFSLMTEKLQQNKMSSNPYVANWNFYGKPFYRSTSITTTEQVSSGSGIDNQQSDNVQIAIQDQNSLLSLYRGHSIQLLERLLQSMSRNIDESLSISSNMEINPAIATNSLKDWQDDDYVTNINGAEANYYNREGMPTNLPLQTYQELHHVRGFNQQLVDQLQPYTTIRPQSYFNPINSPKEILKLLMPNDRVDEIVRLREINELSPQTFMSLSGITDDEAVNFNTSGLLRIKLRVNVNEVMLTKQLDIYIQPHDKHPYIEYEIKI